MNAINYMGIKTLYYREVWRFLKVWNQTVTAPLVTTLLFLAIFILAMGGEHRVVEGMSFALFIAPGLIMMAVVQNAFANSSSSLMLSKVQGVIIDLLMPPISPGEIVLALTLGGLTRGLIVFVVVFAGVSIFVDIDVHSWPLVFAFVLLSAFMLSVIGVITGVWAQTFDQMAAITNYIVTPLAFLSGTFYSVRQLPELWYNIAHMDPFFYMIDGFRYALTGYSDSSAYLGLLVLLVINVILYIAAYMVIRSGYRLKN